MDMRDGRQRDRMFAVQSSNMDVTAEDRDPYLESRNRATGAVVARYAATAKGELPEILRRARIAQMGWGEQRVGDRFALMRRFGDALYARRVELAECVTRETGKPQTEALFSDVLIALDTAHYWARNGARVLRDRRVPHHNPAVKAKTGVLSYEPYGVIGIISPWNYPLAIPVSQIVPALAGGNAVVLKPSELTPGCGQIIAECFESAGLPADLLHVVSGGGELGAALIDARPDKIIFTGSVATGRKIAEACARQLIPSVLELGGKGAMIVLADADLDAASSAAVWSSFTNCGQACVSTERVYVERSAASRFVDLCVEKTGKLKTGPGDDPENEIGPLVGTTAVDLVASQIRDAVAGGARVLCGGQRRADLGPQYFEPTVLVNVDHSMRIMQEETFGPVMAVMEVDNAEEAVAKANDCAFELSASVWTQNTERGKTIAKRLRVGAVMINDAGSYFGIAEAPHGGSGMSGWGRTHSAIGLLEMVRVKYIDADLLPGWPKPWWFGYSRELRDAAWRFIELLYAPRWQDRVKSAGGALRAVFRGHRI